LHADCKTELKGFDVEEDPKIEVPDTPAVLKREGDWLAATTRRLRSFDLIT
jgi:hypothetical protein